MKNKVLYLDRVTDDFKQILYRNKPTDLELWLWDEMSEKEKEEKLSLADFLMTATHKIDTALIAKAKNAQLIQKTGIGVDNIDLLAARQAGLPVSNTPGANASGVAELTILLILALYRRLFKADSSTKNGQWLMWELRPTSFEMTGKTHGFIGFGNIGREVAKRSIVFGTNIVYYDVLRAPQGIESQLHATYLSMQEVLQVSDIVSLHVPLLPETKNLIGRKELQSMKPTALLINVSRGGIVDEQALYEALKSGEIAGAGVDVWESEPVNPDNPLLTLSNVLATPHIGAGTVETLDRVLQMAFSNILHVYRGGDAEYVVNN